LPPRENSSAGLGIPLGKLATTTDITNLAVLLAFTMPIGAENLSTIRRIAINMLRQDTWKEALPQRQIRVAHDLDHMIKLLTSRNVWCKSSEMGGLGALLNYIPLPIVI
jgi:hypothetical protein